MSLTALDVARAALMEVGEDIGAVTWNRDLETLMTDGGGPALRAAWLGEQAAYGPRYLTHCQPCHWGYGLQPARFREPCTEVRDALRGVSCGRAS